MTAADLIAFSAEHGGVVWSVTSYGSMFVEFRWQADEADTPALLNALETAFGARWPDGRVAVFDAAGYPHHGHIYGTVDPGDGSAYRAIVTMFERGETPEPMRQPRRREV